MVSSTYEQVDDVSAKLAVPKGTPPLTGMTENGKAVKNCQTPRPNRFLNVQPRALIHLVDIRIRTLLVVNREARDSLALGVHIGKSCSA
jgi:hypothetical protein